MPLPVQNRQEVDEVFNLRHPLDWKSESFYDEGAACWLFAAAERGCEVLLAEPHRHGAARPQAEPFACVPATAFPDVDYPVCSAFLYRLTRSSHP